MMQRSGLRLSAMMPGPEKIDLTYAVMPDRKQRGKGAREVVLRALTWARLFPIEPPTRTMGAWRCMAVHLFAMSRAQ